MPFPLPFLPRQKWTTGARFFGAPRDHGKRKHAGCDLLAPKGTEIYAVADGQVVRGPYLFYHGTYALEVVHPGFLVRYCEILAGLPNGVAMGSRVKAGQAIAYVGRMFTMSMLHFELYANTVRGPLSGHYHNDFKRRGDLLDPTPLLNRLSRDVGISSVPVRVLQSGGVVS
jgi:murein DD-endopeptidase MepM/ murein hydrolase activator NlpD